MFKFGHGSKTLEILGPSISYFWNDIYDTFDIYREMFVEKLGDGIFSQSEIKRLFHELSEDMDEDFAEIWLEIQNKGKRLRFLETNILPGVDINEQEELLREYFPSLGQSQSVLSTNECRVLYFAEGNTIVLLADTGSSENNELSIETVRLLLDKAREYPAKKLVLVTWGNINSEVKSLAAVSKIELLDSQRMRQEINERNLDMALDEFRMDIQGDLEWKFTKERFRVYLDLVNSASSNIAKKESLEDLSKYLLNGIKGLKVIQRDYRGPSEELDILVANESSDAPLKSMGNPIAVECRHRRKPASSKDIRDFWGKLTAVGLKGGILISLKGVTGDRYDAIGVIRDARKSGVLIVLITLEDLSQVADGKKPLEIIRDCFYRYV
jgi:hypothetical protein